MEKIIGRTFEQNILQERVTSDSPEFIAIYGRRRVGKTFLVRQFFNDKFDFYCTGIYEGSKKTQLEEFVRQLEYYSERRYKTPKNWFDAFALLRDFLSEKKYDRPIIVFLDELPWFDTPKSNFLRAFEYFWNSWGSTNDRLKLIVCGSSTTWMREKMIYSKGGLYNRTTRTLYLTPFNLHETEQYLISRGMAWNRYQIAECYMVFGGIPYYLSMLKKNLSFTQNVDMLFFKQGAPLFKEYDFLFRSLFKESSVHSMIVEALSKKCVGMTRSELAKAVKIKDGGTFSKALQNLVDCDFVREYAAYGKRKRDTLFQLTDPFSLFHLRYVKDYTGQDENRWQNMLDSPSRRAWCGYSFEQLCLHHIRQIKAKLSIAGVLSDVCSWKGEGGQIDLIIDRKDHVINLCEIKYSQEQYEITKQYDEHLRERAGSFRSATKTRKALHLTFISTYGLKNNMYSGNIQSQVLLDDLFRE